MARLLFLCAALALVVQTLRLGLPAALGQLPENEQSAEGDDEPRPPAVEGEDENPVDEPAPPKEPVAPTIREAPSSILLQTDNTGALAAPVPLFAPDEDGVLKQHTISWEIIDELLTRAAEQQNLRGVCQEVQIRGSSHGNRARLEIDMTFLAPPKDWARAPVGLANLVIEKVDSPAGGFLQYDEADGYVFWMPPSRGPAPRPPTPPGDPVENGGEGNAEMMPMMPSLQPVQRRLTIHASAAVAASGMERRLSLRTPRAPDGELELVVDMPDARVEVLGGEPLWQTQPGDTGGTRITARGVGGEVTVVWAPPARSVASLPALQSQGLVQVSLDANRRIQCDAQLTVERPGEALKSFVVELPPGMRLLDDSPRGEYELSEIDASEDSPDEPVRVEVRLRTETRAPATVRLSARSPAPAPEDALTEIAGFKVVEAARDEGHLLLEADGNQALDWVKSPQVIQVDESPEPLRPAMLAARFHYSQPYSLKIKAGPNKTRVHVEPAYVIEIAPDHMRLTADLKCRFHGARPHALAVNLEGWVIESVEGDAVDADSIKREQFDRPAPLEIPLHNGEAAADDVTVRVIARRLIEGNSGSLLAPLPVPEADFLASAQVAVTASDNLEISPLTEESRGLIPETPGEFEGAAEDRRNAIYFRTRVGEPAPAFAAEYEVKSGSVLVETDSEIRLRDQSVLVRQAFSYVFAYEPGKRLELEVPRSVYESGALQFVLDGEPVIAVPPDEENGARLRFRFEPPARLGRRLLTAEFAVPLPAVEAEETTAQAIPLIVPSFPANGEGARIGVHTLRVLSAAPWQAALDEGQWRPRSTPDGGARAQLLLTAEGAAPQLPLILTRLPSNQTAGSDVDRMWLQTWLTAARRRDRAAFQMAAQDEPVRIRLPRGADPASAIVLVNGVRGKVDEHYMLAASAAGGETLATIDLAAFGADTECVVELWYGFQDARPRDWRARFSPPVVLNAGWVHRMYWQLVFPADEHLVRSPPGLNPEQAWWWTGWWWERRPLLEQRELETWIGASEQPAPASGNTYLFSAFGEPAPAETITVRRGAAVLVLSGLALLCGLRLLRAPAGRRRTATAQVAFAGGVLAAALAVTFPETAVLAAQAAGLGVFCVLAAWLLAKFAGRPAAAAYPIAPSTHETATARFPRREGQRSSYTTTATAARPLAPSSSDSE